MDNNWKQYKSNPHIEKNEKTNQFRCKTCDKILGTNAGASGYHSKASHNLTLSGEKISNNETEIEKIENYDDKNSEKIEEIEEELSHRNNQEEDETEIENMVFYDIQREVIKGASRIARDPQLLFEFHKLKQEDRVPLDWDFHLWIKACVMAYNDAFKIHVGLWQDVKNLPTDRLEWQKLVFEENTDLKKSENQE